MVQDSSTNEESNGSKRVIFNSRDERVKSRNGVQKLPRKIVVIEVEIDQEEDANGEAQLYGSLSELLLG